MAKSSVTHLVVERTFTSATYSVTETFINQQVRVCVPNFPSFTERRHRLRRRQQQRSS